MTWLLWFSLACVKSRDPAPEDLEGLIRYLYTNWEDPVSVEDGLENMAVWLETEGQTEAARDDGFILDALDAETIGDLEYPTRTPLSEMVGVAISRVSPYSIDRHAQIITEFDQKWNSPTKYEQYDRNITEGSKTDFLSADAHNVPEFIFTHNDVIQERLGIRIPYILLKNYRWTTTEDGRRALLARSWVPEYGCSSDDGEGGNCVELSFSVDLLYEKSSSEAYRMTASWNYVSLIIDIPQDIQIDQLAGGIIGNMESTDEYLAGE